MKRFFLSRALREKLLMLAFALLAVLIWGGSAMGRGRALWNQATTVRAELATQNIWFQNAAQINARAVAATKSLDPARTLNGTRLVGELSALARQAGLNPNIGSQHTERTEQFAFHAVQVRFNRAELGALLKFYELLSQRSPYMGLEQFAVDADRANPGLLNASFRVVAAELGP